MAKSVYEPKKIVRYNNTITPVGNLPTTAPVGPVSRPAVPPPSTPPPGPINQPVTPPPPPPPTTPVQPANPTPPLVLLSPGFGFEFDGSTALTGSYEGQLLNPNSRISFYFEPLWSSTETGSFTVFHIGPDSSQISSSLEVKLERESTPGSSYATYFTVVADTSGSIKSAKFRILPDIYSGSLSQPQHFSIRFKELTRLDASAVTLAGRLRVNGEVGRVVGSTYTGNWSNESSPTFLETDPIPSGFKLSMGKRIQNTDPQLPGRLDEVIFSKGPDYSKDFYNKGRKLDYDKLDNIIETDIYSVYTFDTDLTGTAGHSTLSVVGTETYYTGSFN